MTNVIQNILYAADLGDDDAQVHAENGSRGRPHRCPGAGTLWMGQWWSAGSGVGVGLASARVGQRERSLEGAIPHDLWTTGWRIRDPATRSAPWPRKPWTS